MAIGLTGVASCGRIGERTRGSEPAEPGPPGQTTLAFTGLEHVDQIAVDSGGDVYVVDVARVLKLAAGSETQTELPFAGIAGRAAGIAVDPAGSVYVAEKGPNGRVRKLTPGAAEPTQLPFAEVTDPTGLAVDAAGNVYVTDYVYLEHDGERAAERGRVLKLAPDDTAPTELPFSALWLHKPSAIAVSNGGDVYVLGYGEVWRLAAGTTDAIALRFGGHLASTGGIAVDAAGNVYVTELESVRRLAVDGTESTELPTGALYPDRVAVDAADNVYVGALDRVVKLPPR